MSIDTIQGTEKLERALAERYLLARLIREVRVLRDIAKSPGAPVIGSYACSVCFRPFPHGGEAHAHEAHYLALLPESGFGADGFKNVE
jgi:hypothetical protein